LSKRANLAFSLGSARVIRLIVVRWIIRVQRHSELLTFYPRSAVLFWSAILWFQTAGKSKRGLGDWLCARQKCNTCPDEHDPCWASLVCITMTVMRCMYMSHTQHTHALTHKHIHNGTHTHTHTPHYNMFEHTTLIQLILSQRWAKVLGWISSSDLDSQPCVVWLCLVLLCSSVYVRMYVSVCSAALFSFALLAGGRFF
jgi:hypothetical protein